MTTSQSTPARSTGSETLGARLLLVLALLAAAGPIGTDLYLASLPEIVDDLGTTASTVQLTLTAYLVGLGVGQLVWGPLSDRIGRLRPLLLGSTLCVLASVATVLAPTIEVLVAARLVQALAAAAGVVVARAVISDLLTGYAASRAMSLMMTIMSVAPVVAPVAGGALAGHVPWRGVLGVVLAVVVLQLVGVLTTVRETLPPERRTPRFSLAHVPRLLARPGFRAYVATMMCTFGAMFSYIASSTFVYQNVIGTSPLVYGLGFGVNALGLTAAGLVSARLAGRRVHPARTIGTALPVLVGSAALVLLVVLAPVPSWLLLVPLFVAVTSVGFVNGNVGALALEHSRDVAGSGSAVLGGVMFLFGGVVSPLVGVAGEASAVPFAVVMLTCATLAWGAFALARAYVARHPETEASLTV